MIRDRFGCAGLDPAQGLLWPCQDRYVRGAAGFDTDVDRLTIDDRGDPVSLEIRIPRSATLVEIRVGGRRVLVKQGARITSDLTAEPDGSFRVVLTPPVS